MAYFDTVKADKVLTLERPCLYYGEEILEQSQKRLKELHDKYIDKDEPQSINKIIKWLGRLEKVIQRHILYHVSIDEAVWLGFID